MKKIVNIICFILVVTSCIAQNSYVELDTITYAGVKVINQGKRQNALSCQWQKGTDEVIKLTPYEVKSYSTGGKGYVAKDITINGKEERFFIEKMATGELTLYFIKNKGRHFFIEKDSIFSELTKQDAFGRKHYKETLLTLCSDCNFTNRFLKNTWYNWFYLRRFVQRYNECEEIYRPIRFGVMGGWDITGCSMLQDAWDVRNMPFGSSFTFGAFVDIPILQSKVSFHPEIFYSKQGYRLVETSMDTQEKEGIANIESCNVPLLVRYTWWKSKWNPFLNLGMVWYHYSRLENSVLTANVDNGALDIRQTTPALSPAKYAVLGGGGVWYKISRRNAVFIETRTAYNLDKFTCNVLAGINF